MLAARRFAATALTALLAVAASTPSASFAANPGDDFPGFAPIATHLAAGTGEESATDVVVQSDGKLVVSILDDAEVDRRIVRLMPDGSLDPTFGSGGTWHVPSANNTLVRALALTADGKILYAGEDATRPAIVVGRLTAAGVPDTTFSGDGVHVSTTAVGSSPLVEEVIAEPDGRVTVAGVLTVAPRGDEVFLGRLLASGEDDPNFSGTPFTTFGSPNDGENDAFDGITRLSSGAYVLAVSRFLARATVWHVSATGSALISANVALPDDLDAARDVVAIDATHAALLATGSNGSAIAALDVSGTPTVTGGVARPLPPSFDAHQLARQPDGRLVVAGIDSDPSSHRAVARVNTDGSLDSSFGASGVRHLPGTSSSWFYLDTHSLALTADGAILSAWNVDPSPRSSAVSKLVGRIARVRAEVIAPAEPSLLETTTTFTVRVSNDGPDSSGSGTVAFSVSEGLRIMSVNGIGCTADSTSGRCRIDDIAPATSRDVLVRVRASATGTRGVAATATTTTFDDAPGDETGSASLAFNAPEVAAPAAAPEPVPVAVQAAPAPVTTTPRRTVLTLHRIRGYHGRVLRGCGSYRVPCRLHRVQGRGRIAHAFLRIRMSPPPAGRRMTVLLMQQRIGRRWVTRYRPRVPVTRFGRTDVRLPYQWRQQRGAWRIRVQTVVPKGKRPIRSWFLRFNVR